MVSGPFRAADRDGSGSSGCVFTGNTQPCEDGNVCTVSDTCSEGVCLGGPGLVCNDGDVCTLDACDEAVGCTTTPLSDTPCDDSKGKAKGSDKGKGEDKGNDKGKALEDKGKEGKHHVVSEVGCACCKRKGS